MIVKESTRRFKQDLYNLKKACPHVDKLAYNMKQAIKYIEAHKDTWDEMNEVELERLYTYIDFEFVCIKTKLP